MEPCSLFAKADADPVVAPVYRWYVDDDLSAPPGFRVTDSLEGLVRLWLELFDHGLYYTPDHDAGWIMHDAHGVSIMALRAGWSGSEYGARRSLEHAARVHAE